MVWSRPAVAVGAALVAAFVSQPEARADAMCRVVEVDLVPALTSDEPMKRPLQIVAWVEKPDGTYVQTIFITAATGTYGIGNRPGRWDFNSGPRWPYGRRITVFPVWAHKHGMTWPELIFQDEQDSQLSHAFNQSPYDSYYCRPALRAEAAWLAADAGTCASQAGVDRGKFGSNLSRYPPRNDVERHAFDNEAVDMFATLNPFDAVSRATPPGGLPARLGWPIPEDLESGDYVLWLEVAREFDHNSTFSVGARPAPTGFSYSDYGEPYRGQPSVLYRVPFTVGDVETIALTADYAGYSDPDGLDGAVRQPDASISTGVPGSGAGRLQLVSEAGETYRVKVTARPEIDETPPAALGDPAAIEIGASTATIAFLAPGDDGLEGRVMGYDIRYLAGEEITEENFATGTAVTINIVIGDAGTPQSFELKNLLFETDYSVGIRAFDNCGNRGPLAVVSFSTATRQAGEVDACFVATAAYGTLLANDVDMLRRFRDGMLRRSVFGELAVEAYYTFGPAVAGVTGESDLLRASARRVLAPFVERVRGLAY